MATKFTPLHDRILVRRVEEEGTTRGGIIIPDTPKTSHRRARSFLSAAARAMTRARCSLSS